MFRFSTRPTSPSAPALAVTLAFLAASTFAVHLILPARTATAETVTFFGDFADGFGSVPIAYSSDTPYDPGSIVPVFHEGVTSIPKFDPALGTLTDITVFISPTGSSPIFYSLGGSMTVTKSSLSIPDYGGSVSLMAELMVNYEAGPGTFAVLGESIALEGAGAGPTGSTEFTTSVAPAGADGMLTGSASVFGAVDLADFVGPGLVDSLYVDLIIQDTADFALDNATATAGLGFDVFDADSGIDDDVIGVTYTYTITAIPEPSVIGSLAMLAAVTTGFTRRRRKPLRQGTPS